MNRSLKLGYLSEAPGPIIMSMDEASLVELYMSGRAEAFSGLYELYAEKIYKYLFYRTFDKELSEDLASQTFVKALDRIATFDPRKGTFSAWIYRIARNSLFDHLRTEKRTVNILDADMPSGIDIGRETEAKETLAKVKEYMKDLTPEQRDIVLMRVWDGMSFKEIASVIGKSEKACQMTFSRTIASMKKELLVALLVMMFLNQ